MPLAIGDILTRQDGKRYKLVGIDGDNNWIGAPVDDFGPPETLDAGLLASGFGVEDAAKAEQPDEQAGWDRLALASRAMANAQAAVSGDLAEGDDLRVTFAGDRHEGRGTIRPPDVEGEQAESKIKALRAAGRRLLRGEPSPEQVFRREADRALREEIDAQVAEADARAVAENAKRDPRPKRRRS